MPRSAHPKAPALRAKIVLACAGGRSNKPPARYGLVMDPLSYGETLQTLALARGTVDRVTEKRNDQAWLDAAWQDSRTRVLVVSGGRALVRMDEEQAELIFLPPAQAPAGTRLLLGQDAEGIVYFAVNGDLAPSASPFSAADGVRPASLREVGSLLGARDAGLLTHAVALANWYDTHTHCPLDGTPTVPAPGGHSAICPRTAASTFPGPIRRSSCW